MAPAMSAALDAATIRRLHRTAGADTWNLSHERFGELLQASVAHGCRDCEGSALARYLESLHVQDLALAAACSEAHEGAWDRFIQHFRPILYRAADAIDRTGAAREAADSLYAELFGLTERDGERRSLFRYFHGRSSLATWLRVVLAQRYVDTIRRTRRLEPLPDDEGGAGSSAPAADPDRPRHLELIQRTVRAAIDALEPKDRLRLACYYAQDLTLAEIGRLLREHEATVSRHLARTRRRIREAVERRLRQEGMSEADMADCIAAAVGDAGHLDLAQIFAGERKESGQDRST